MAVDISYLIPDVRMVIGDNTPPNYRYIDDWIKTALILAVKSMRRYLGPKYLVSTDGLVSRDETSLKFTTSETDGIIEPQDEYLIVIKASILILQGGLEANAWSLSSWRDSEISVSNQEVSRVKQGTLKSLMDELNELVLSPTKRLARTLKGSLPGYVGNLWEHKTDL